MARGRIDSMIAFKSALYLSGYLYVSAASGRLPTAKLPSAVQQAAARTGGGSLCCAWGLGRQNLVCTAGIHGREAVNPVLLLKMIEEYGQAFRFQRRIAGFEVRALLKRYAILFLPLLNPDGYEVARTGFSAISNPLYRRMARARRIFHRDWKLNARGVDINRNFPQPLLCPGSSFASIQGSELETQTLMRVFQSYETAGYLDFHSRGKILYYYRNAMPAYI